MRFDVISEPAFADGTVEFVPAAEQALANTSNAAALSIVFRIGRRSTGYTAALPFEMPRNWTFY
jgi:hypothetical protein